MRTTRRTSMQPALKNSRTMTAFKPVPPTEKQVYTLASSPPATHIWTVPKPSLTTRCRKKSKLSTSTGFREKAAAALQSNEREPRICIPSGTATPTMARQAKTQSAVFVPDRDDHNNQRNPEKYIDQRMGENEHARAQTTNQVKQMRTARGTTKPPAVRSIRLARCHRDTELRLQRDDQSLDSQLDVTSSETQ